MNLFRIVAELFLLYLLYKFIFDFIIPIYESSKKIKRQFSDMQDKMQNDLNNYQGRSQKSTAPERPKTKEGDYIDFEEVKTQK